jgi:hypothetical protein
MTLLNKAGQFLELLPLNVSGPGEQAALIEVIIEFVNERNVSGRVSIPCPKPY